ncbi:helix-hairpin-helix domain-containing protein [Acetobacterium woodii]|uniref:ComEA-like protein n=1 Tax=Acetobacterium woodii (strain ATCC 29683 / DSM 1030 / JCM 2381 / KCTC 1655 / WB1) TaxID=931626 RepID=H6LF59_ACEWD|nr:helix-hairpin-helix domain-containing protein [Acetobacterium woodii]AFA48159.1 ComEA-like protein [Acetobacterium woodii DSM 1030]
MDKLDRNKILYILIVLVFLGVFWGWYYFKTTSGAEMNLTGTITQDKENATNSNDTAQIMVYITGEVVKPGVVSIASDTRLVEALDLVGGLTEAADISTLNLARKLQDEEKIHIPTIGEVAQTSNSSESKQVNINTATLEELKTLPGIGDVIAKNIIDYREKNGLFTQLDQLKEVNRIGDKIYDGLIDSITI